MEGAEAHRLALRSTRVAAMAAAGIELDKGLPTKGRGAAGAAAWLTCCFVVRCTD